MTDPLTKLQAMIAKASSLPWAQKEFVYHLDLRSELEGIAMESAGLAEQDVANAQLTTVSVNSIEQVVEALQCALDYGMFEDNELPGGIEGIPGYEFPAKWGDLSQAQVTERAHLAIDHLAKEIKAAGA